MLSQCPHCQKSLQFTDAQRAKVEEALKNLQPGKTIKLSCPQCKQPIELKKDGEGDEKKGRPASAAKGVLDDVLNDLYAEHEEVAEVEMASLVERTRAEAPKPIKLPPTAPAPPDVSWLASEDFTEQEVVKDVPMALVLMGEGDRRNNIVTAFEGLGYHPELANSPEAAIERMRFVNFAAVVLHTGFEGGEPEESEFHQYLTSLPMSARRYIYYVLVGPMFHSMYDLEALAYSANLVVNDNELDKMDTILKKGLSEYDNLFGPLIEVLKEHGKK